MPKFVGVVLGTSGFRKTERSSSASANEGAGPAPGSVPLVPTGNTTGRHDLLRGGRAPPTTRSGAGKASRATRTWVCSRTSAPTVPRAPPGCPGRGRHAYAGNSISSRCSARSRRRHSGPDFRNPGHGELLADSVAEKLSHAGRRFVGVHASACSLLRISPAAGTLKRELQPRDLRCVHQDQTFTRAPP